jgi:YesN/AraC family two-component response regulator
VVVSLSEIEKTELELRISDNGPGIPEDALPNLFERFYRVESSSSHTAMGTGLGLAITRELVNLMDGTIKVESLPGEGTEFVVRLPVNNSVKPVTAPDIDGFTEIIAPVVAHHAEDLYIPDFNVSRENDKPLLLIAEDNSDVVRYLETILGEKYCIEAASDGKEALRKALELIPDIVIADIMMPVMDGIELTRMIKEDIRTSHIPVLILSARADVESRIEGLSRGADAYLSKPFSTDELKVILSNLLDLRKKLQSRYTSMLEFHNTHDTDTLLEDSFMNRVKKTMESNIMDENFDIKKLCSELAMSRTQLYRKFRTLTDMTVSQYMQHLRLHKAMLLITQNNVRVSEAAYQTGFKNLSHFSRAFTEEFGTNPSKIRGNKPEGGIS